MTPKLDNQGKSWFDKINVWDYVEISMKGGGDEEEKIIMRGLVDEISKSESWETVPRRNITISGRDLGTLFTDFPIYYLPELGKTEAVKSELKVLAWKVELPAVVNAQEAFDFLFEEWSNQLDLFINNKDHIASKIEGIAESMFPNNKTNLFFLLTYEGPWWNAFQEYQDHPFHELFLYDANDLCYLILRPARLKDFKGQLINSAISNDKRMYPDGFEIDAIDKISVNIRKSAEEIYNFYLTVPAAQLLSKEEFRMMALSENADNPKNSKNPFFVLDSELPGYVKKFGLRKLEAQTIFIDLDIGQKTITSKKQISYNQGTLAANFLDRGREMNKALVNWFLYNQFHLKGQINIRGTNKAIIGTYVLDKDENIEYYLENIVHQFITLQSYNTSLGVSRGMPKNGFENSTRI